MYELFISALIAGVLLGGLYAGMTVGLSISFGILDIVNIAHPAFIIAGSYIVYIVNQQFGLDPLLVSIAALPFFYFLGSLIYRIYHVCFERRGKDNLRGLAFFFGLLFVTEVLLILAFGVDFRSVQTSYSDTTIRVFSFDIPMRMLISFVVSVLMLVSLQLFLRKTFNGRAIMAVAQDQDALALMGADPIRIKRIAFSISVATTVVTGALLIMVQPIEPSIGREYIGRIFAICVLGGMGSLPGTLIAAVILGIADSMTATFYGPSWAPAVAFGFLLLTLAFKPSGLLGRQA